MVGGGARKGNRASEKLELELELPLCWAPPKEWKKRLIVMYGSVLRTIPLPTFDEVRGLYSTVSTIPGMLCNSCT